MTTETAIDRAIRAAGSISELARRCHVSYQAVQRWRQNGVPAERCPEVEIATDGLVKRQELRPDVFGRGSRKGST